MNTSLLIIEGKYGDIDTDDSSFRGYYIIKFFSSPYTLQTYLSIDGKVISSSEMVYEVNYFFSVNINSTYYVIRAYPMKNA